MDGEWVGEHVTKDIYIETDGRHAFYAGGQTYAGVDGETILEMVTSEMLHWVKHGDGRTTLDASQITSGRAGGLNCEPLKAVSWNRSRAPSKGATTHPAAAGLSDGPRLPAS